MLGVVLGMCEGSSAMAVAYIPATYFGRRHLGAIQAVFISSAAVGSGVGPLLLALSKDLSGSFTPALLWLGWLQLAVGVLCALAPNPTSPDAIEEEAHCEMEGRYAGCVEAKECVGEDLSYVSNYERIDGGAASEKVEQSEHANAQDRLHVDTL